jgi:hypothetical protein
MILDSRPPELNKIGVKGAFDNVGFRPGEIDQINSNRISGKKHFSLM